MIKYGPYIHTKTAKLQLDYLRIFFCECVGVWGVCVCVCVCRCVWDRKTERERGCVCVCVWGGGVVRERESVCECVCGGGIDNGREVKRGEERRGRMKGK